MQNVDGMHSGAAESSSRQQQPKMGQRFGTDASKNSLRGRLNVQWTRQINMGTACRRPSSRSLSASMDWYMKSENALTRALRLRSR